MNATPSALETAANAAWSAIPTLMQEKLSQAAISSPVVLGLSTILTLFFTWLISLSIYRIWFHTLSKHPGPLLCKLTSTVWAYHFTKGSILQWEAKQHKKYGQTVRLGPNRLSFIDPRAWKDIYGHKFGNAKPNVKNLDRAVKNLPSGRLPMALEPTTAGHAAQRKQFNPAFGERAWKEQEPLVQKYVEQLMRRVSAEIEASADGETVVDIATLYNFMTFDVMGDLTFGEGLGQLETGIESSWVPAVFVMYKLLNKRSVIKAYPLGGFLFDLFAPKGMLQDSAKHMQHCSDLIAKRLEKGNDGRPDIFGHVLKQPGDTISRTLMNANANMLMVAGTETTATTLTTVTHLLLRNPDKMEKLLREIRDVPDRSSLNSQVVQRMQYLNAVIEEALRFCPSGQVGLGTQREIAPGGNQVCDDFLAEETEVAVAAWTMSNSSLHWKDPAEFVPERWLLDEVDYPAYHKYDNRVAQAVVYFADPLFFESLLRPHELHRMRREAILPVFATPLIMSREHLYEALVQRLLARFRAAKGTGAVLTLGHAFRCLAIDLTCTTNLGYDFGFVDVEDFEKDMFNIARTLGRMNMISRHIGHWFFAVMRAPARWAKRAEPVSPGMIRVLHFRNLIDQAVTEQHRAATTNITSTSEKTGGNGGDDGFKSTVQHILKSNLPAHEKELTRVVNEVWLCINVGIDTEGQAIAFATFMLLSHPEELAQLREELAECEKRLGRLPTYQELKELNYLNAVVQESFRLNHPIAGRLPRTDPDLEIQYRNVVIPRGVTVSVSTYDIYLYPTIFPDPHRFQPKRWLELSERKRLRKYINNYGRGTRSCVGMDVANMGIYLNLGRIFAPSAGFGLSLHDTLYERDVAFDADFFGAFPKSGSNHIKATVI
ncbi:hypothetical protein CSAL01_09100 [Colletotrichum salicis]|uniref:Cytochrome P450 n=1 Tax=Colletotrichum salicis TaxID=1209931 RepID=A0A135UBX0_9PEZI|nr:hypothetical protein CSAL01_09100 [Colletotrichum salicis]